MKFTNKAAHTQWAVLYPLTSDGTDLTECIIMESEEAADFRIEHWGSLGIRSVKVSRTISGWKTAEESEGPGVTLEDLEAAPIGSRVITADDRIVEKTPEGWTLTGFVAMMPIRADYEEVSSETAMNLSPLYMIGERK